MSATTTAILDSAKAMFASHESDRDTPAGTSYDIKAAMLACLPERKGDAHSLLLEVALLKIVRAYIDPGYRVDHYVDLAAYAAMAGEARRDAVLQACYTPDDEHIGSRSLLTEGGNAPDA